MLPGMAPQPGLIGGGGGGPPSIEYLSASSNNVIVSLTITCSIPAGVQAGDLLIASIRTYNNDGSLPAPGVPAGWTLLSSTGGHIGGRRLETYYKIAEAGDVGGSVTFTDTSNDWSTAVVSVLAFRGLNGSAFTAFPFTGTRSSATPANINITSGGVQSPVLVFGASAGATGFVLNFSTTKSGELVHFSAIRTAYTLWNVGNASAVTISMADSGAYNLLNGGYFTYT